MSDLTVGSLFSGIGGLDLGLERAGMRVVWQCEKDAAARRVLKSRWPDVPCFDDVEGLRGDGLASVDVLCGGFPCQDLSVAGRRAGLAGERSRLFHAFMRLTAELAPDWVLLENVPGLLSSNEGRDMGVVLGSLADLGYGWCYRVLDAQYFGVAQRRRRVFVVGCAGNAGRAAQVLLEPESCDGDIAPRREAGEGVAGTLGGGSGSRGWAPDTDRMTFVPAEMETAETLRSHPRPGSNCLGALVPAPVAFMWQAAGKNDASGALERDFTPTLPRSQTIAVAYPLALRGREAGAELEMGPEGTYNALRAGDGGSSRQNLVAYRKAQKAHDADDCERWEETDAVDTLTGHSTTSAAAVVDERLAVRRLMPVECERLQGFPDGWTEPEADSARYRMLGNAVCVSVAEWIGHRIVSAHLAERVA